MTPEEELDHLEAELERLQGQHPDAPGVLRLTDQCLRGCSQWKWEQRGWTISEGQACGIMNGNERERRLALMSVLKDRIDEIELVPSLAKLEVVSKPSASEPAY